MDAQIERFDESTTTHLLYEMHEGDEGREEYAEQHGQCCFCGHEGAGQHVDEATSEDYFSDDPLLDVPHSDHVCARCAWCMDRRTYKQGHWLVHSDGAISPSTGDLLGVFRDVRGEEYQAPLAVHVTSSPIRSSHSYLWTPVNETLNPLTVVFDRERVRIEDWQSFADLVAAVEDLRLDGFTFDELRSGEPRVMNLQKIGRDEFLQLDGVLEPHRSTARLELALTLSRSADDQPRTERSEQHDPLKDDE